MRAAENGVWVAHAAISGVSAVIAPDGHIVDSTHLWSAATLVHTMRFAARETFYTRSGDWVPLACIALSAVACIVGLSSRSR